jgi:hypothetical protein
VFDVPKDLPENVPAQTQIAGNKEDLNDLAIADLGEGRPNILQDTDDGERGETGIAPTHSPPLGALSGAAPVRMGPPPVSAAMPPAKPPRPRAPNFRGKTMRAVLAEAASKGLSVLPDGSGIARVQSPRPGAPLHQGERIRVQFAQ